MALLSSRVLSGVAKVAITLLLLWLLFRKVDYAATLQHLQDITPFTAVIGLATLYGALALGTARWYIILRSLGKSFTAWTLLHLNLIGLFFNQALPSAIGGDGVRIWLLYRRGCSFKQAFNSVLIDRIAGFVVLSFLSLYGLPTLAERLFGVPPIKTVGGAIVGTVVILGLLCALARAGPSIAKLRVARFIGQIIADGLFLAKRPGACAKIALLSFGNQLCNFFLVWLILRNLGADVSAIGVMIVAPVVFLLIVLPVSIAGWGVREGLFVVCFGLLDVPKDVALAASIVFGLINLLAGLIGGLFWFVEPARSRRPMTEPYPSGETLPQPPAENA